MTLYIGSCHCQKVRFQVETDNILTGLYRCNCSLCQKKSIVMKAEHKSWFTLLEGEEFLLSYQWNKNIANHFFCKGCGVYTHHKRRRDPNQICINFACLDNVEMPQVSDIGHTDGASHD